MELLLGMLTPDQKQHEALVQHCMKAVKLCFLPAMCLLCPFLLESFLLIASRSELH